MIQANLERGSEFVDYIPAVLFELGTLVFAAWIAISIIRVRSRVAAHATRSDPVHRALAVRTSIFGLALFVALLYALARSHTICPLTTS
jgi:Flp pilus assembly protein protease CpaA